MTSALCPLPPARRRALMTRATPPQKRGLEEEAVLLISDLVATCPECDEWSQLAHGLRVDGQERPVVVLDLPIPTLDPRPALGVQRHAR